MNPNLNNHMGFPPYHQGSHSSSQLQPSAPSSVHFLHTQPHAPQPPNPRPSPAQIQSLYHLQPAPQHLNALRDPVDQHQLQQQTHIDNYKSSAEPAFHGYIETTHDALIIFNACFMNHCSKVKRRLHERERRSIQSGSVYVFDEAEAGIKRWTDGRLWSPSRILNNFLVYREIDHKRPGPNATTNTASASPNNARNDANGTNDHPPSAPSTVTHHPSAPSRPVTPQHQQLSVNPQHHQSSPKAEGSHLHDASSIESKPSIPQDGQDQLPSETPVTNSESQSHAVAVRRPMNRERERALVGSLTSTYKFRPDGLVKKTISLAGMHMISYYKLEDVLLGRLRTPKTQSDLRHIHIDERFLQPALFRSPPAWGIAPNGSLWVQDEGPDEPSPISTSNSAASSFQNGQRSAPPPLPNTQSTASNSDVRGSLLQSHTNASDRLLPPALPRPGSSSSSAGSPTATSPVSSDTFPLLAAPNLSAQAGPIGRTGASSSNRYEPYARPTRSPPLPVSSNATNGGLTDQHSAVSYYAQNHSTGGVNGYSTHAFIPDSHSTSLVAPERNARSDQTAHNSRNLDSIGQVSYGDSGAYRTHTSTSGGGESMYGQYGSSNATNNSTRSASVPPIPYGLPSINRLIVAGQTGSTTSSNTDARAIGDYQFSASSTQQQAGRLSSPNLSHGSYGNYLPPVPTEFRGQSGGASNLPVRENNHYNSSQQPQGQTTSVSGTQSPTFLYPSPPTSTNNTSFSSSYQFSTNIMNQQPQTENTSRRGSAVGALGSDIDRDNGDGGGAGTRISDLDRISSRVPQRGENENSNTASNWGQMGVSHAMKTEESGSG